MTGTVIQHDWQGGTTWLTGLHNMTDRIAQHDWQGCTTWLTGLHNMTDRVVQHDWQGCTKWPTRLDGTLIQAGKQWLECTNSHQSNIWSAYIVTQVMRSTKEDLCQSYTGNFEHFLAFPVLAKLMALMLEGPQQPAHGIRIPLDTVRLPAITILVAVVKGN